jgi:sec-independent protein translocase protein TatA
MVGEMPGFIGPWGIIIIVLLIVVLYGPKRLPGIGRSLGRGVRELKDSFGNDDEKVEPEQATGRSARPRNPESTA